MELYRHIVHYSLYNYILDSISRKKDQSRVIIVLDAPRNDIYDNSLEKSSVIWLHEMMKELVEKIDIEIIDLTSHFHQDYLLNKISFNAPQDGHWGDYGHAVAAKVIFNYINNNKN